MADNTNLNAMTGGDVISTDDIAGVKVQRIKVQYGSDGSATDVDTGTPLPVTISGVATSAKQDIGNTSVASIDTKTPALGQAVSGSSVPMVLPASQITTLTPPAAITGFATAAKQPALGTAGTASADVLTVQGKTSMTPLLVDPSGVTSPVSLASVPSHAVTNAGTFAVQAGLPTTVDTNSGVKSASTLRIVLATDQPALTNKLLVTPDSVALPANQSVNQAQVAGTATDTNSGNKSAGTQRIVIATDQPNLTTALNVSLASVPSHAVTNAGTFAVQAAGDVASGSSDSGNPQKIGGVGKTANPTAVTDGQRVNATFDKLGKQIVVGSIRDLKADAALALTASTTETTLIAAIASTFNDLYGLIVTNTSATACEVIFRDVAAGTARFSIDVPPTETRGFMLGESAAYKQATVNTAWTAQCVTSVSSIKISALYVKNT